MTSSNHIYLFTDGSVNNQSKVGYGAYLAIVDLDLPIDFIKTKVQVKLFEQTSSTKLELQALLWSLHEVSNTSDMNDITLTIYTDCQNIIGLERRRERLEENNYFSGKGKRLNNFELYKEFYQLLDKLKFKLVKVIGHQISSKKDNIDKIFTLVDQASRQELRNAASTS